MEAKKTKIVCTIGPATLHPDMLKKLVEAGMDVARLNMSHGSHEEKREQIKTLRKLSKEFNKPLAVFADLQGPKLRLGMIEGVIEIKKGSTIHLSVNPQTEELPMQFDLSPFVKPNQRIFLNDGLVALKVESVKDKTIKTTALNDGWVSSNKGVNVPDTLLTGATFTPKDKQDAEFALGEDIDYLALSFVQTPEEVTNIRKLINKHGKKTKIIVKIEKPEAVINLQEIIQATDAVMVARGDLAIETSAADVPIIQQKIIRLARQYQKPVIVATQMLESMTENPRPTRAEVSDVANAVLYQVDGVMLSGETASGKYPIEVVQTMKDIILEVEKNPEYKNNIEIKWESISKANLNFSAIGYSAANLSKRIGAKLIAAGTVTGNFAKFLSSFRPDAPIIAVTHDEQTYNQLALVWGVTAYTLQPYIGYNVFLSHILDLIKEHKLAKKGDEIVVVTGAAIGTAGTTDTIKIAAV